MRYTIITIIAAAWLLTTCCRTAYPDTPADHRVLLDAIRQVESGGNDAARGDNGRSLGPLQTSRAAWADATRHGRVTWDYDTLVWSWPHCQQVAVWYWQRYGCETDEARARCWNAGPGWRKKMRATDGYWQRVKGAMK